MCWWGLRELYLVVQYLKSCVEGELGIEGIEELDIERSIDLHTHMVYKPQFAYIVPKVSIYFYSYLNHNESSGEMLQSLLQYRK
jgi:hypothetical protein